MALNAIASTTIQSERIEICRSCKWFVPKSQSCGTLVTQVFRPSVGEKEVAEIKENNVKYYKKPIKLCGCHMPSKVMFTWASCPADKWLPVGLDKDGLAKLKVMAQEYYRKGRMEFEQQQKFLIYMRKLTGKNIELTSCASCLRDLLELALQATQDVED